MTRSRFCVPFVKFSSTAIALTALFATPAHAALTVFSASGPDAASIQTTVDAYRTALGALNPNVAGSFGAGRREINWDGVPDNRSDPNFLPNDFFNINSPRGAVFSTPGSGFMTSADNNNPTSTPTRFGFPSDFVPFSNQRLFAPVGSVITDVSFFVPGSATAAARTFGFGAIFSDVEVANLSRMELFGEGGTNLFSQFIDTAGNGGFTFLGVIDTDGATIERVRLTSGDSPLIDNGDFALNLDAVVMDDFLYGEPSATGVVVPEPGSLTLVMPVLGLIAVGLCRRRPKAN